MKILLQNGNGTKVYWFAASTLRKVLFCVCFIDSRYYAYFTTSALQCATCGCNTCDPHPGFPLERELFLTCVPATGSRWWYSPTMTLTAFALPLEDDECLQLTMEFLWFMWSHRQPWHWPTISLYRPYHWCCQYSPWFKTLSSFVQYMVSHSVLGRDLRREATSVSLPLILIIFWYPPPLNYSWVTNLSSTALLSAHITGRSNFPLVDGGTI